MSKPSDSVRLPLLALLLLALAGGAQAGTVTLTGEGVVHYTPDAARFNLTAQSRGDTAEAARSEAQARVAAWEQAAQGFLGQLQSYDDSQINVTENRVYDDKGQPKDESYFTARQRIGFNLTDLGLLNQVVSAAESANLSYQLTDNSYYATQSKELRDTALAAAIDDARQRCQFVAEKLGANCGEVESLRVMDQGGYPRPVMRMMSADAESVSHIGDREIRASVEAVFELD